MQVKHKGITWLQGVIWHKNLTEESLQFSQSLIGGPSQPESESDILRFYDSKYFKKFLIAYDANGDSIATRFAEIALAHTGDNFTFNVGIWKLASFTRDCHHVSWCMLWQNLWLYHTCTDSSWRYINTCSNKFRVHTLELRSRIYISVHRCCTSRFWLLRFLPQFSKSRTKRPRGEYLMAWWKYLSPDLLWQACDTKSTEGFWRDR